MTRSIENAAAILRSGGLVAFPTETVYGLGADATNAEGVRRIFAAKGRPSTNPLIVHVADARVARRYAKEWPPQAEALAQRFWPGPLTLVVPKAEIIASDVSAGLETIGLRSPDHPMALELLRAFDGPVAAPSANRSNRVSPTTAEHVRRELGHSVDVILDGGPCRVGIESTVLDVSGGQPVILRPGSITREPIEQVIGPVALFEGHVRPSTPAQSPGQQQVHYSPATPAFRFEAGQVGSVSAWFGAKPIAAILFQDSAAFSDLRRLTNPPPHVIAMPADPDAYARRLYAALHEADAMGAVAIVIEMPPATSVWAAVRDRLARAARSL